MLVRYLRASGKLAASQIRDLSMLILFLAISHIYPTLFVDSAQVADADAERTLWMFAMAWLPEIGAGIAFTLIVLNQIARHRLVETMLAAGFPAVHAATLRRLGTHLHLCLLTWRIAKIFARHRKAK